MVFTRGHQGVARYIEETVPGATPANPDFLLFSPETVNVSWGIDKSLQESLDTGELDVHEFFSPKNAFSFSVEYHLYPTSAARLLDAFIERLASGAPRSFTLEVIPDQDDATVHYYRGTGWRPNTITTSVAEDGAIVVSIEFLGGVWADPVTVDPGIGTGSREAKAAFSAESVLHFATAAISLDGSPVATILNSLEVTVENDIQVHYDVGNANPVPAAVSYGVRKFNGSADISLDDGAAAHWARVSALSTHTLSWPFGTATGARILTLEDVVFPSLDPELTAEQDALIQGVDFNARTVDTTLTVP